MRFDILFSNIHTGILRTEERDDGLVSNTGTQAGGSSNTAKEVEMQPTIFRDETPKNQAQLVLTWIFGDANAARYLGGETINRIPTHLSKMKCNGYLRILNNVNLLILKEYCSQTSWELLQSYKEEHGDDELFCFHCEKVITQGEGLWTCDRCFKVFHTVCHDPKMFNNNTNVACFGCYFQ